MTLLDTPPCRLGIPPTMLSALRDQALAPAEAQALQQHILTCAACQVRLAAFDRVAQMLRLHRDLEPNGRIWPSLQPRLSHKEHATMFATPRFRIGGGIAALSAILVVVLFALVLVRRHSAGPASLIATQPPTPISGKTATPPMKSTPPPTPITLAGLPTPQQAWGTAGTTVNVGNLTVAGIMPDGQHILGYQLSADGKDYDIGWFTVATRTFTTFDQSPVNGTVKRNNPPTCCTTDGRFIVGANGSIEGSSTNAPWYYDTQTGQLHAINSVEFSVIGMHAGVVYHKGLSVSEHGGLYGLNLLTGTDTAIPNTTTVFNVTYFAWPDFTYTVLNADQTTYTEHIRELQANADATLPQSGGVALAFGDTAFFTPQNTVHDLQEWDHIFTSGSSLVTVTSLPGDISVPMGMNARVVLLPDVDYACSVKGVQCTYGLLWDRALHKTVLLSPSSDTSLYLAGTYFAVIDHKTNELTLFDSSTFPVQ